jgi:alpha-L-rhamnosidase
MPVMAIDFWGDACILVPWAEYLSTGDIDVLTSNYDMMKKYVKACKFWAGLFGVGKHRYIWHTPATFHFGDWVAPDEPKMSGWQKRSKWTATASLCHTSGLLAKIAELIGNDEDSKYYQKLSKKVAKAYVDVFTDGNGKLKNEFQTAYVLPLAFDMFDAKDVAKAADNLVRLIKDNDYCIGTGFPGTPYLLFALADNGHVDDAYKMLTCDKCPSWLYEVKAGGTTIWERWDALKEDGSSNFGEGDGTGGMVSFNHYASGAVGNFLYSRLLGIQPIEGGYKQFSIKPVLGGGITYARGWHECPYGKIACDWRIKGNVFEMSVSVPVATTCRVTLPDGSKKTVGSGDYNFVCNL